MSWEIVVIAAIVIFVLNYSGRISTNRFVKDNSTYLLKLKESDYDFFVRAKYGQDVDPNVLFEKRIKNAFIVIVLLLFFFITSLNYVKVIFALAAGFGMFKMQYLSLKKYYKNHLHIIDSMLPHYLKGLEILIQHYTVPVAIGKSIEDAPEIFKEGLGEMIDRINAGDSSIEPYMEFARKYPVRDSMRMMRLLYRLSLGRQERKQEQLMMFSRTISNLQQKARETRYKNRLEKMEGKTTSMLLATGLGLMVLLIVSVMQMIQM
ncbi:MAG: hypothetical protein J5892_02555 [Bacilli bacterium]|nr:hypothetical protein [Bacilli bacterium]